MNWKIGFSKESVSFLDKNGDLSKENVIDLVLRAIGMFSGHRINIDIKKLKGEWNNFYRIRKGRLRVIVSFDFESRSVLIERIDWRGSAYK
ncbi:MAG: hypothetical protein A2908_00185 [Candidatus Staskawiczbacteria bacterium RIFCSPLOWO2_01_FULL_38_12b]|uniref:Plasmid stabilization protein n=1 Tax=Candidatus Staskawiczbacteria bacterium RIFCSPLOWO2_01_FULL_38_12b TaxID=1802214 RepID=A0A1G2IDU5_9BACT|nr:MAG: hypothetical protein A2908_00185 [Candidatus Staskawiczbacteria bacterium RIFCSPLOWO2_01_FULL_38_12b]